MDFTTLLVFLTTFLLVYLNTRRPSLIPPGPNLWPLVGNLLSLLGDPLDKLSKLRLEYGDVLGIYLGGSLTVFVNGYGAVKEVLVKRGSVFSWRPETTFTVTNTVKCMAFANGRTWKENRRFALSAIYRMCFNEKNVGIESKVQKELTFFVERLKSFSSPTDIANDINLSIANVMSQVLLGIRPGYADERFQQYIRNVNYLFEGFQRDQMIVDSLPFTNWKPFGLSRKYERLDQNFKDYYESHDSAINKTYTKGRELCLAHFLMTGIKGNNYGTWKEAINKNSENWIMVHEFMLAGSESTTNTLNWILLHLIRQPLIQDKARDEVDKVIGKTNQPAVNDRQRLPYLEAIIMEGLRIGQPFPIALPHTVEQDVIFRGFRIPKNTAMMVNIASVLKDPEFFPDPESFKPERFLSKDGGSVIVPEAFIPFSMGPRSCPGESLSRIELFLYLATMLQKFYFSVVDDEPMPSAEGIVLFIYSPQPYKVTITPREV